MEHNGLGGGLYSGLGSGMLRLEMPLHQQQAPQNPQNPQNTHHLQPHPPMVAFAHHEPDHHSQSQQSVKAYSHAATKQKQLSPLSDEDEPGFVGDDVSGDGKRKISPWQRMKWTDSMVRLLIMAVFYIGDEVGSEGNDPTGKKKAGGLAQKKGKWKSVSRAMLEKGFYVSPQQCEDKFNDLNKRYKRVNDILGKGTACKVVENQSLLDTMDLSPKMKEEVKKLLNSKHLFFREMCAYHSSCGHASAGPGAASAPAHSPDVATDQSHAQNPQATQLQQQRCSHSSQSVQIAGNLRAETEGSKMGKKVHDEEDDEEDDEESEEDEYDEEEDEYEGAEGNSRGHNIHGHEYEDDHNERFSRKRARLEGVLAPSSSLMQQFSVELTTVIQDGAKSPLEKNQWIKMRLMQLEEQQVNYQCEAFELEKQRLKWVKFSSKKEREMEKAKLENERRRLENDRMMLLIRQKELELHDLEYQHHQQQQQLSSNKRSDPSSITG